MGVQMGPQPNPSTRDHRCLETYGRSEASDVRLVQNREPLPFRVREGKAAGSSCVSYLCCLYAVGYKCGAQRVEILNPERYRWCGEVEVVGIRTHHLHRHELEREILTFKSNFNNLKRPGFHAPSLLHADLFDPELHACICVLDIENDVSNSHKKFVPPALTLNTISQQIVAIL